MPRRNDEIAAVFDEIADLLELGGDANPFRVRAYRNAARLLRGTSRDVSAMLARGEDLCELPGIGKDLAGKIGEVARTGACELLRELRKTSPAHVTELLSIPGLGPRRVKTLVDALGVHTRAQLLRAARGGRVRALAGFGAKSEAGLLRALEAKTAAAREPARFPLGVARQHGEAMRAHLRARCPAADPVELAGSVRRGRETVGDVDVLACARVAAPLIAAFTRFDEVARVVARGTTAARVVLRNGLQLDLRVVPPESFGAALHYFTGSKAHNIAVRRLGQARGLKINEYGVYRGRRRVAGETEQSVFAAVGLPFVPPELREDQGELEAAKRGALPRLVTREDLRGDLHAHTRATDGRNTLEQMALAAKARGLEYVAVTEHSRALRIARGLDARRLAAHCDAIDRLNERIAGVTLLKGIEVDILEDGRLDLPDTALARLDLVVAAVHSAFELPRARQTARVLRALENRYVTALAHPTARLLGRRAALALDVPRVLQAVSARGCFVELNAQPERLDLPDTLVRMAKAEGALVSIASDAHSTLDFDHLALGVTQARRGWLEAADVANTRSLAALRKLIARARG